ncbi:META domain-containing protein [Flagellimonas meishanensis]|uniref:META domain-containing protein n=1 Tax=Flagellimonas meishanensis TaxID=2873264 RepID=UPI001CA624A3|nr:META domain-containing protein [[Muricauda] meishanensis]
MKNILVLICTIIFASTCAEKKKEPKEALENNEVEESSAQNGTDGTEESSLEKNYFKASGSQPLWGLSFFEDQLELSLNEVKMTEILTDPIVVENSNLKMYRIQNDARAMDIIIAQKECLDSTTNKKSPYTVTISYRDMGAGTTTILEGCGAYAVNPALNGIWTVKEINGKSISSLNFQGEKSPYLELDLDTYRFSGLAGCNRIAGGFVLENENLRFSETMATKMACPNLELETKFLSLLNSNVSYRIEKNRLYLYDGNKRSILQFQKTD